jgi:hypothetical protein
MSFGEKIYLAMVVFMFGSFMVLLGTLSWLDAKEERVKRWRDRKNALAAKRANAGTHAEQPAGAASNLS